MPLFEYVCRKCGHAFELLVTASRIPACPKCGSEELEQAISAFAVARGGKKGAASQPAVSCGTGGG
jgi:putative FmdB family regulatory protein